MVGGSPAVNLGGFCPMYTTDNFPYFDIRHFSDDRTALRRLRDYCVTKCFCVYDAASRDSTFWLAPRNVKDIYDYGIAQSIRVADTVLEESYAPVYGGPTIWADRDGIGIPEPISIARHEHKTSPRYHIGCMADIPLWPEGSPFRQVYERRDGYLFPYKNLVHFCASALVGGSGEGNVGGVCDNLETVNFNYYFQHPYLTHQYEPTADVFVLYCLANCWCQYGSRGKVGSNRIHWIEGQPQFNYGVIPELIGDHLYDRIDWMQATITINGIISTSSIVSQGTIIARAGGGIIDRFQINSALNQPGIITTTTTTTTSTSTSTSASSSPSPSMDGQDSQSNPFTTLEFSNGADGWANGDDTRRSSGRKRPRPAKYRSGDFYYPPQLFSSRLNSDAEAFWAIGLPLAEDDKDEAETAPVQEPVCNARAQACSKSGKCGPRGCVCRVGGLEEVRRHGLDPVFPMGGCEAIGAEKLRLLVKVDERRASLAEKDSLDGSLLGRAVDLPCVCNISYVSHGCCDSMDGYIWEKPEARLGSLKI
ncbi:MAG: hypothetical protein M1814_004851 [Vezdaea aestivalis]|nr:MAG: hypothetical protein M1814_004851 [Vezdaea aestivalis]